MKTGKRGTYTLILSIRKALARGGDLAKALQRECERIAQESKRS